MFLVDIYRKLNETDSVMKYLLNALNSPMDIYYQGIACERMIEVATYRNDSENVKKYANLLTTVNDSILKLESQSTIEVLEQIHELDRERSSIKTQRLYLGIALFVLLLIALFIIWKLHKKESKQKTGLSLQNRVKRKSRLTLSTP